MGQSPTLDWEIRLGFPHFVIIGVDEVGRGCLAGPVVAGALALPKEVDFNRHLWLSEVRDSKALTPKVRERLAPLLESWALSWGVGVASVEEIDQINIFHASHLAMVRAVESARKKMKPTELKNQHLLVDGKFLPKNLPCAASAVVKGDLHCLSIAAASVLAKVWRDVHMAELDLKYPGYGFSAHKGYGTPAHCRALKAQGVCSIHRRTFAPVAALL